MLGKALTVNQISFPGITSTLSVRSLYSCNSLYIGNEKNEWEEITRRDISEKGKVHCTSDCLQQSVCMSLWLCMYLHA